MQLPENYGLVIFSAYAGPHLQMNLPEVRVDLRPECGTILDEAYRPTTAINQRA